MQSGYFLLEFCVAVGDPVDGIVLVNAFEEQRFIEFVVGGGGAVDFLEGADQRVDEFVGSIALLDLHLQQLLQTVALALQLTHALPQVLRVTRQFLGRFGLGRHQLVVLLNEVEQPWRTDCLFIKLLHLHDGSATGNSG
jgi:hypothetical protein